ncbi:MAG: hypothetical protein A3A65_03345 [Candidatus Chisholmbacteria bacterium RIFCSPLOWO2_01_FULL_49_14]|uniref:DUF192 domain-containing protein n=1 Tax=Candidatus Chisholmbacteria bacterium RIFCSPLOWO2_01_FULL_49_14 TaxID=1797593 RepID=A0A1G1W0B6_9BACT|nr:MAG: hypothetical protein A3A65_03345 [Candidatus Chisholmbacteria bacterium RIFCSPLOWO2_01_FULL_49_14]
MRNTIIISLILIVLGLAWLTFSVNVGKEKRDLSVLRVGEQSLGVEIADSAEEWSQGLSGREQLSGDEGMLFVFDDQVRRSFWMRQMRFSLDMMFIRDGRINEIVRNVPAPSGSQDGTEIRVQSQESADWVLEVNSGWAQEHGVEVGDEVTY